MRVAISNYASQTRRDATAVASLPEPIQPTEPNPSQATLPPAPQARWQRSQQIRQPMTEPPVSLILNQLMHPRIGSQLHCETNAIKWHSTRMCSIRMLNRQDPLATNASSMSFMVQSTIACDTKPGRDIALGRVCFVVSLLSGLRSEVCEAAIHEICDHRFARIDGVNLYGT